MNDYSKLDQPEILPYFFAPRQEDKTALPDGATDVSISVAPDVQIGCRFFLVDETAPCILFFHGKGETVSDFDTVGPQFNEAGLNFFVAGYRGYGWSSGQPSVSAMFADAGAMLQETLRWKEQHNCTGPLFIMGRSLGSACAIDVAARFPEACKGLIIESGFADTLTLAKSLGVPLDQFALEEHEGFNNLEKIARIEKPTFIFHGARDTIIPPAAAEKLQSFSGAKSKEFQIVPGAEHNTVRSCAGTTYFRVLKQFVDKITGASSWRKRRMAVKKN